MIVVIAILAILAAILIPSLTNYLNQARIAKNTSNARSLYSALTLQVATNDLVAPTIPGGYSDCTVLPSPLTPGVIITSVTCGAGTTASVTLNFTP